MTRLSLDPGPLAIPFTRNIDRLDQMLFSEALWNRQLDMWSTDRAVQQVVGNRLGWLDALDFVTPHLGRLSAFAGSIRDAGFTDVVLLGMGGSSLAPEVLRHVLPPAPGVPRFRMLDSVDPTAVGAALDRPESTLFVLASKSGSTIEPNAMAAEAIRRVVAAGHTDWASRFVAITDEHTALHTRAVDDGFLDVFVNPSDIGGRYSALSFFGLVPAALMGVDLPRLVESARVMEAACRVPSPMDNPGLALGALMAAGTQSGRDKLTLVLPASLRAFGLWVEQLVAESTGKQGTGVVPITGEPADATIGADRIVVAVTCGDEQPSADWLTRAQQAGAPLATLAMPDAYAIGAEFFRWEIATAAAGRLLDINPFDEPNVQQAKDATRVLLGVYQERRQLPFPEPHAALDGVRLTLSSAAAQALDGKEPLSFLSVLDDGDYLGLLAYLPDVAPLNDLLDQIRGDMARATGRPTMFGYGPRYLHSTGQLHKGGANNGVFVVVAADATEDLAIPDEPFSFGVLEAAQALGDFQSLDRTGRRALFVHLPAQDPARLRRVMDALLGGTT